MPVQALGLIEMQGFAGIVEAADAAVKAAPVSVVGYERIDGGLVSIRLQGDVGAVQVAVEAGAAAGQAVGKLVSRHVIPGPHQEVADRFGLSGAGSLQTVDLDALPVAQLRRLARETPGLSIQGREISHANREQLVAELKKVRDAGATS